MDMPVGEQIDSLLDGSFPGLLRRYGIDPDKVDPRTLVRVDRSTLVDHLTARPDEAEAYLRRHETTDATHDVARISRDRDGYRTAWMDHAEERSVRHFRTLAEAVAEHVLLSHGMY